METETGFEPANSGFASHPLRPLGYSVMVESAGFEPYPVIPNDVCYRVTPHSRKKTPCGILPPHLNYYKPLVLLPNQHVTYRCCMCLLFLQKVRA